MKPSMEQVLTALRSRFSVTGEEVQGEKVTLQLCGIAHNAHRIEVFPDGDSVQVDVMLFAGGVETDSLPSLDVACDRVAKLLESGQVGDELADIV